MKFLQSGFTLVELLIVVSIIGILASVGLGSYLNSQRNSRDGRRIADMDSIQKGFEQYYLANGHYDNCNIMFNNSSIFPQGRPTDPHVTVYYGTCTAGPRGGFCYCADLENTGTGNSYNWDECNYTTPNKNANSSNTKDFYCVQNRL